MKKNQIKKQAILELIDNCFNRIKNVNNHKELLKDKEFRGDVSIIDKLVVKISKKEPKIKPVKFNSIRSKSKKKDSFAFLIVIFCLLAVFLGFFGKYLSRPGFYSFAEQDKYAQALFYALAILTAIIGIILYIKYRRIVLKKKSPVSLLSYRLNLRNLRNVISKIPEKEVDEILKSI